MNTFRLVVFAISFVAVGTTALSTSNEFFPKPISSELPMYPETARMARVAGTVKLWFVLNGEGEVTQTNAVSGNPLLRYEYFVEAENAYKQQKDERNGYQSRLPTRIQD